MPLEVPINWAKDRAGAAFEKHAVLFKNSGAIAIGSISAAVLGFVFWWLVARSFSPEVIGKASAFISLMAFIGLIGEGGLGTLLIGEIIRWPGREHGLISAAALVALSLSLAAGVIGLTATELVSTLKSSWIDNLLLLLGCGLTGLTVAVDQAFVGMLQSTLQMLRQFSFSVFKLSLIPVAELLFSDVTALLFMWVVALTISLVLPELSLRRSGRSLIRGPDFKLLWNLKRKTTDHYMLNLGTMAPVTIMPYLVAVLLSLASNAAFMVIWMVATVSSLIPAALATVLFPAIRSEPHQYRDKMLLSLGVSLLYAIIFAGFIFLYSNEILTIFNPAYAEIGKEHLRLMGLGMFGAVVKFHVCAAARLTNSMRRAALWFCTAGLFELSCVVAGAWAGALEGVAIGWATAMTVEGAVMLLLVNPCRNQDALTDMPD